jgi:hypothetical protein
MVGKILMPNLVFPDLNFPFINYSRFETPWDLTPLLYIGGANVNARKRADYILNNKLGDPKEERLPLLAKFHDLITANLIGGGSRHTARSTIRTLRYFYGWADGNKLSPTYTTAERLFIEWTEHLLHRQRVKGDITLNTVYHCANKIASLINAALNLKAGMLSKTRVRRGSSSMRVLGNKSEKQNLEETFTFGQALLDISDALSLQSIRGKLPVVINFRSGKTIEEWAGLMYPDKVRALTDVNAANYVRQTALKKRRAWEEDTSDRTRSSLLNLRIEAELLIFIAQTGMNLAQAYKLKMGKFSYQSHFDGYQVRRVFKERRRGEVEFSIYSEYRVIFERYLKWRDLAFSKGGQDFLFPFLSPKGRSIDIAPTFSALKKRSSILCIKYIAPRELRQTRVNWLMRHIKDPALVAEISQHHVETLLHHYVKPHHQTAIIEISRFLALNEVAIPAPGPGLCVEANACSIPNIPNTAPIPDCINPAGCLFCIHHRDLDSADHVWSLMSYRHLKTLELAGYRYSKQNDISQPAAVVVKKITEKLKVFGSTSSDRVDWINESRLQVEEGDFHPKWDGFIRLIEADR